MKTKTLITALSITALALTGCSTGTAEDAGKTIQPLMVQKDGYDTDMPPMDDDYDPTMLDDPETAGHGTFKLHSMNGTEIEFDLPTSTDHEAVQEIEEYRQTMRDDEEVTYVVMDVDNREGMEEAIINLTVYDPDGNKYEFDDATNYVSYLRNTPSEVGEYEYELLDGTIISGDEETDLYNQGIDIDNSSVVDVAERGDVVVVYTGTDLPDEFSRVAVNTGYQLEDAYLAD